MRKRREERETKRVENGERKEKWKEGEGEKA